MADFFRWWRGAENSFEILGFLPSNPVPVLRPPSSVPHGLLNFASLFLYSFHLNGYLSKLDMHMQFSSEQRTVTIGLNWRWPLLTDKERSATNSVPDRHTMPTWIFRLLQNKYKQNRALCPSSLTNTYLACVNPLLGSSLQSTTGILSVLFYNFNLWFLESTFLITSNSYNFLCYFCPSCKYFSGLQGDQSEIIYYYYKVRSSTLRQSSLLRRYTEMLKKINSYPLVKQSNRQAMLQEWLSGD